MGGDKYFESKDDNEDHPYMIFWCWSMIMMVQVFSLFLTPQYFNWTHTEGEVKWLKKKEINFLFEWLIIALQGVLILYNQVTYRPSSLGLPALPGKGIFQFNAWINFLSRVQSELQKRKKLAPTNFLPHKISTKKWPKNDPKLPNLAQKWPKIAKMAQKLALCIRYSI